MCALYSPYKAVGIVCDSNPFAVNRLGEEIFLSTTIGKSFQVFRLDKLAVCLVSKPVGGRISCFEVIGHDTFVAVDNTIVVYNRTNVVRKYTDHKHRIRGMLAVGHNLVTYDDGNNLLMFNTKQRELSSSMHLLQEAEITCVVHPSTYVNKFLVGYSNGQLELWNVHTKKLIYSFKSHVNYMREKQKQHKLLVSDDLSSDDDDEDGEMWNGSGAVVAESVYSITCISQSPALDVVAIGFSTGDILLVNLKMDLVLISFKQDGGSVTSLSFRTDVAAERFPYMVSSSSDGRVHVWNLGTERANGESGAVDGTGDVVDDESGAIASRNMERKLQNTIDDAHFGPVSKVSFLYGEPIMITSGAMDNCIKVWIFDSPDGTARLLRSREGHHGAPLRIRYYGGTTHVSMRENATAMSCEVISAGSDGTVRLFNTALETQNREMSQKPILKKLGLQRRNERLPECVGFDFSETRNRDWGDMVTIHRNHCNAYIWRFKHRVITDTVLKQPQWNVNDMKSTIDKNYHATAVGVSNCGNFCVVGHKGGGIYKYNLQSGLPRGSFPKEPLSQKGKYEQRVRAPANVLYALKALESEAAVYLNKSDSPSVVCASVPGTAEALGVGHTDEVTGLYIDICSAVMVSCGLDGLVIFWDFLNQTVINSIQCNTPLIKLEGFRDANFVAIAGQDSTIRVFDVQTCKLARRFSKGHKRVVTDMCFAADARRLLSSSADGTVRVWDLPTGKCLSWMSFESPVNSIALSLSGEFLLVSQVDKEGIYMYVDRSLYETVHFWKEPTAPTPVVNSLVKVQDDDEDVIDAELSEKALQEAEQGSSAAAQEKDSLLASGAGARFGDGSGEDTGAVVVAKESIKQRGEGRVTLSAVPKAYWASLFHLEAIKARNKPKAPPAAPVQAPFFLPTIVQGGSTPSFPTPQEYKKIQQGLASSAADGQREGPVSSLADRSGSGKIDLAAATNFFSGSASVDDTAAVVIASSSSDASKGSKKRAAEVPLAVGAADADLAATGGSRILEKSKKPRSEDMEVEGAVDSADADDEWGSAGDWGSAWQDDDAAAAGAHAQAEKAAAASVAASAPASAASIVLASKSPASRIIGRRTQLPRCKMAAYLFALHPFPSSASESPHPVNSTKFNLGAALSAAAAAGDTPESDTLLQYMKTLPPPAVDVQLRALCTHDADEEGIFLLRCWVFWLTMRIHSGVDFEVLQAYLHRTMYIYADTILTAPRDFPLLAADLELLRRVNSEASDRFRALVQKNTCLFKMIAKIPIL